MQLCKRAEDTLPRLSAEWSLMNEQERFFISELQVLIKGRTKSLKEAAKEML
ncbi:MAG: hypothetical protein PHO65_01790 [Sulfurovum sp.]|nr:hypothetical protein [Sulfurovum sp.]